MYQLNIIDDIATTFAGSNGLSVLSEAFDLLKNLVISFSDIIITTIEFIIGMFTFFPTLLVNSLFNELPYIYKVGLTTLFTIFIALFILKLFQLLRFW